MPIPRNNLDFQRHMLWPFYVQWFEVSCGWSFCWYLWNYWPFAVRNAINRNLIVPKSNTELFKKPFAYSAPFCGTVFQLQCVQDNYVHFWFFKPSRKCKVHYSIRKSFSILFLWHISYFASMLLCTNLDEFVLYYAWFVRL